MKTNKNTAKHKKMSLSQITVFQILRKTSLELRPSDTVPKVQPPQSSFRHGMEFKTSAEKLADCERKTVFAFNFDEATLLKHNMRESLQECCS